LASLFSTMLVAQPGQA